MQAKIKNSIQLNGIATIKLSQNLASPPIKTFNDINAISATSHKMQLASSGIITAFNLLIGLLIRFLSLIKSFSVIPKISEICVNT